MGWLPVHLHRARGPATTERRRGVHSLHRLRRLRRKHAAARVSHAYGPSWSGAGPRPSLHVP